MTVKGDSSVLKLNLKLDRAVSSYVIDNSATSYAIKSLEHTSKNSNSLTQVQSDYLKWYQRFSYTEAHCIQHLKPCVKNITCELHFNKAEKACSICLYSKIVQVQGKKLILRAKNHLK